MIDEAPPFLLALARAFGGFFPPGHIGHLNNYNYYNSNNNYNNNNRFKKNGGLVKSLAL